MLSPSVDLDVRAVAGAPVRLAACLCGLAALTGVALPATALFAFSVLVNTVPVTFVDVLIALVTFFAALRAAPYVHEVGHAAFGKLLGGRELRYRRVHSRSGVGHQMAMTGLAPDRLVTTAVLLGGVALTALTASLAFAASRFAWPVLDAAGCAFAFVTVRELTVADNADFARLIALWTVAIERRLRKGVGMLRLASTPVVRKERVILDALELELRTGSIVGILGANGSGKTTLLEMLAGVLPESKRAREIAAGVRVAYAPSELSLFSAATFGEMLNYYAAATSSHRDAETERLLQLTPLMDQHVQLASKGEAQRLSLAVALQQRADLILLDEPDSGLDPAGRRTLHKILQERAERGACVVLSSHLVDDALRLCTHIAIVSKGKLERYGDVAEFGDLRRRTHRLVAWVANTDVPQLTVEGFRAVHTEESATEMMLAGEPGALLTTAQRLAGHLLQFAFESNEIE